MNRTNSKWLFIVLFVMILSSLACALFSGAVPTKPTEIDIEPTQMPEVPTDIINPTTQPIMETDVPLEPTQSSPALYDTKFPLPDDVQNFEKLSDDQINFKTNLSIKEIIAFYRSEFSARGLEEWDVLTMIDEDTFNIVFVDTPTRKEIVVQGVQLDENTLNVNMRYEDI